MWFVFDECMKELWQVLVLEFVSLDFDNLYRKGGLKWCQKGIPDFKRNNSPFLDIFHKITIFRWSPIMLEWNLDKLCSPGPTTPLIREPLSQIWKHLLVSEAYSPMKRLVRKRTRTAAGNDGRRKTTKWTMASFHSHPSQVEAATDTTWCQQALGSQRGNCSLTER